jgi:transposase InsO family protein
MNVHQNARLTPQGRLLMVRRIEEHGWTVGAAAEAAGLSIRRTYHWLGRYRAGGEIALQDRSSAPARCRAPVPAARVAEIERLRRERMTGPGIARQLGMPRSTVGLVLRRLGLGRLTALDPRPPIIRYERERPGDMIHIDIKKLGRIDGVGHRITGHHAGMHRAYRVGWDYLHVCVDDASRLAYTEILPDEKKESATGFLIRALCWFERHGIAVARVMTDNGSAYRSGLFRETCAAAEARHVRTRPYTPRTNGKAERFIQSSLREWAYAQTYQTSSERAQAMPAWIDGYNTTRPHTGIKGLTPWSRMNNLLGNDI